MLSLMLVEADGSKPKGEDTDEDGHEHGGTLKVDATCCDAEIRYPTPRGLLRLIFGILGQKPFIGQLYNNEVCLIPVVTGIDNGTCQ